MTPTNKDIKVLGRVVSVAVDSIVVDASQVKDSTLNEFQDIINKRVQDKLDSFDHKIVIDGRSQGDETIIDDNGISTSSIYATSGEFDTLTVDDSISADNILIDGNGSIGGDFSIGGNLTVVGESITIADKLPSAANRSETTITPFDVTTEKIVANSYIPVNSGNFDPSQFNEPGRYYILVQNTLNSGSPCKYGVFVDVLCQYDKDDGSLIGIHQTYTMPSGANTPGDTTADELALEVYKTWDGSTWTSSEYPAGKTSFV